jgi:hypothetical protein
VGVWGGGGVRGGGVWGGVGGGGGLDRGWGVGMTPPPEQRQVLESI